MALDNGAAWLVVLKGDAGHSVCVEAPRAADSGGARGACAYVLQVYLELRAFGYPEAISDIIERLDGHLGGRGAYGAEPAPRRELQGEVVELQQQGEDAVARQLAELGEGGVGYAVLLVGGEIHFVALDNICIV